MRRGAAGAPWGPAPPSTASWRTDPGTGPSPHLFVSRFTWACREPNPQKSWQGDAGIMLISLCLITAVLKAQCLLHYPGRSDRDDAGRGASQVFISPKSTQSEISFWLVETDCTFSWEGKGCISHFQHFPSFRVCGYKDLSFTTENTKVAHLYLVCSSSLYKHWKTLPHGQTHDRTCRSFLSRLLCRGGLCHVAS